MHPGKKIPNIEAGVEFQEFSIFIRSLISDETPSEDDLLRVFKVFDKVRNWFEVTTKPVQDDDGKLCEAEAAQFNKRIVKTIAEMRWIMLKTVMKFLLFQHGLDCCGLSKRFCQWFPGVSFI